METGVPRQSTGPPVIAIMKVAAGGQGFKTIVESQDATDHLKRAFMASSPVRIYDFSNNTCAVQDMPLEHLDYPIRKKRRNAYIQPKKLPTPLPPSPTASSVTVGWHYLGFVISYTMWTDVALSTGAAVANALIRQRMTSTGVIYMVSQSALYSRQLLMLPKKMLSMHMSKGRFLTPDG